MSELENNNGWTEWSKYILKELEKLGENCDSLAEEINGLNVELTKISGMKHAINDLKDWKNSVDESVNIDDLKNIKSFYINNKDIKTSIDSLKDLVKKQQEKIEELESFKTKVYTFIAIASFLVTTAVALIKVFL
jgi:predicted RNase H-like nuclease (RuvC/YqgF family)